MWNKNLEVENYLKLNKDWVQKNVEIMIAQGGN